jgi:thiamine-phosphate pyrophosphorylase
MVERIHFITNNNHRSHWQNAELACKGGIKWIQLRIKDADDDIWRVEAEKTQDICAKYGAVLIINDNIQLTKSIIADGVHLGLNDTPTQIARQELGDHFIVGGTANTLDDIVLHFNSGVDYVGLGPYSYTETKKTLSPILGINGYKSICEQLKALQINIPIIAIGGIKIENISEILTEDIYGIAISSLITDSADPSSTASLLVEKIAKLKCN